MTSNSDFLASSSAKRVAIDIDFTIADVGGPMLDMHNEINSTNYKPEDATDWSWSSINMTRDQFNDLYVKAWVDKHHTIGLLLDPKLLKKAEVHYQLEFVTSRGGHHLFEATVAPLKEWLKHHGLSHIKLVISPNGIEKSEFDYSFYIDDSPTLAHKIAQHKEKTMFIVDAPYNREVKDSENIIRVQNADVALSKLIDMADSRLDHK